MSYVSISSTVGIGIFILAYVWTVLDYIVVSNFWKSPFYYLYNAKFFGN
jgi:hypothetical protein